MSQIYLPGYPSQPPGEGWSPGFPGWNPGPRKPKPSDNIGALKNIYQTELGREADQEGLNYWAGQLDQGSQTIDQVKKNIQDSEEGRNYFVKRTYKDILGREADKEGYSYWLGELNAGKSRDSIIDNIYNSDEGRKFRNKTTPPRDQPPRGEGPKKPKPTDPDWPGYGLFPIPGPEPTLPGRPDDKGPRRDKGGVPPREDWTRGWLDFYNDQNQKKIQSGSGKNAQKIGGTIVTQGLGGNVSNLMNSLVGTARPASPNQTTGTPAAGNRSTLGAMGGFASTAFSASQSNTGNTGNTGDTGNTGSTDNTGGIPSDFGKYTPATFGGNLYNQGYGNLTNFANKHKDNEAIQGFYTGAKLDSNQAMMNMGLDLLYQKGQMSQWADYHGGMENLKTGNTLKLLAAEGGIVGDLMGKQGDIESRQIGEKGDQERKGLRVAGQENRQQIRTQGDQDRRGLRVKGQETRAEIQTQGDQDRRGYRVKGEEERAGYRTQGRQERMTIGAQGIQDRMLTQEKGSEERLTQRDKYREERKMRADARGAVRRSGARFFG